MTVCEVPLTKLCRGSARASQKSSLRQVGVWGGLTLAPSHPPLTVISLLSFLPECLASFLGSFEAMPMMFYKSLHTSWAIFKVHMGIFNDWKKASFHLTSGHFSFVHFFHDAFEQWSDRDRFWYLRWTPVVLVWPPSLSLPYPTVEKGRDLRPKLYQSDSSGNFNHEWNNIRSEK